MSEWVWVSVSVCEYVRVCASVCECVCAQSSPSLCNPMECSPPGIFQARILEWPMEGYSNLLFDHWSLSLWKKRLRRQKWNDNVFVILKDLPFGKPIPAISHSYTPDGSVQLAKRNRDTAVQNKVSAWVLCCVLTLSNPVDCSLPDSAVHEIS